MIMKHIAGNMRSRWTDFLTTDGEKPDRDRESEFVVESGATRAGILMAWENGWKAWMQRSGELGDNVIPVTIKK